MTPEEELTDAEIMQQMNDRYGKTHTFKKVFAEPGTEIVLSDLKQGQSVCWGDGKTYYFLLTEK